MAAKPFSKEDLNFFKFSKLVLDEFPKVLRQVFIRMWDSKVAAEPGFIPWDDSITVWNKLVATEGGKIKIPTTKSIEEWDCTALFRATIFAKTFGVPCGKVVSTLNDLYLKTTKLAPGSFHPSVRSLKGNQDETYALAIDQLRLLRNTLCHPTNTKIVKDDFDNYIKLVKDALSAVNVDTSFVDCIGKMSEEDFPLEKVQQLNECRMKELQAIIMSHENFKQEFSSINEKLETLMGNINLEDKRNAPDTLLPSDDSQSGSIPSQKTENPPATLPHSDTPGSSKIVQQSPAEQGPPTNSMIQNESGHPFESRELMRIARIICGVWQSVAKLTGMFKPGEIDNIIDNQNYSSPEIKADKMLNDFNSRLGTRKVLASAIEESGHPDVAAKVLCGYYISKSN